MFDTFLDPVTCYGVNVPPAPKCACLQPEESRFMPSSNCYLQTCDYKFITFIVYFIKLF